MLLLSRNPGSRQAPAEALDAASREMLRSSRPSPGSRVTMLRLDPPMAPQDPGMPEELAFKVKAGQSCRIRSQEAPQVMRRTASL